MLMFVPRLTAFPPRLKPLLCGALTAGLKRLLKKWLFL